MGLAGLPASPGDFIVGTLLDLIDKGDYLSPREVMYVDAVASIIDIMTIIGTAEILALLLLHPAPTFSMLSMGSRLHLTTLTNPVTWALALAVAGTEAQIKSQTVDKSGVRGTGSFGIAPSQHLVNGRPWWS